MIRHVNAEGESVTAWYGGPDGGTRPPGRDEEGPDEPPFSCPSGRPPDGIDQEPHTAWGQWTGRMARPVRTPRTGLAISHAKPRGSRNCAKFSRQGNPILHKTVPVGKTLGQSQTFPLRWRCLSGSPAYRRAVLSQPAGVEGPTADGNEPFSSGRPRLVPIILSPAKRRAVLP